MWGSQCVHDDKAAMFPLAEFMALKFILFSQQISLKRTCRFWVSYEMYGPYKSRFWPQLVVSVGIPFSKYPGGGRKPDFKRGLVMFFNY